MKKRVYQNWDREDDKRKSIEDLRDSLPEYFGPGWKVLQTPIVLDVELIDILLLQEDGRLTIVKVIDEADDLSFFGKMVFDYGLLNEKREKLRQCYSGEYIDINKDLHVVLFMPAKNLYFVKALGQIGFVVDVYTYLFVQSGNEEGIVLDRVKVPPQSHVRPNEYDSMLRIMGENVRSEHSDYPVKDEAVSADLSAPAEKTAQQKIEKTLAQQDIPLREVNDFIEKTSLSEEELIAFFDLEKKVDSYCNMSKSNLSK
jgi:hypothetical protein